MFFFSRDIDWKFLLIYVITHFQSGIDAIVRLSQGQCVMLEDMIHIVIKAQHKTTKCICDISSKGIFHFCIASAVQKLP